jgi:hypothetical protein
MLDWLKGHVFLAAWLSPLIALVGLIWKKSDPTNPVNWSKLMIYVAFLTGLAVIITPGVDPSVRSAANSLVFIGLGFLIADTVLRR